MNVAVVVPLLMLAFGTGLLVGAFRTHRRGAMPLIRRPEQWALSIYTGTSPTDLVPAQGVSHPVLTANDASDADADFVADPFLFRHDGRWHLFFELLNRATRRGEIALATSPDALTWTYERVVLAEPFHLSYPQVIAADGAIYMVPESQQAGAVRLYRATDFPTQWTPEATLLHEGLHDPTLFRHDGRWWMFASVWHHTLRLFHADTITGPWHEHPQSPVVTDDPEWARPAGRVVLVDGVLTRFAQDCTGLYGASVRAARITTLTVDTYAETRVPGPPVVSGSGSGWNAQRMHHVDAHQQPDGTWRAAVDGDAGQKLTVDLRDV
mgnify:CR=1 FL=1